MHGLQRKRHGIPSAIVFVAMAASLNSCGDNRNSASADGGTVLGVCTVMPPKACPDPPPRYADMKPIFDSSCNVCHARGVKDGPWPLDDYQSIVDWADLIRADLLSCVMPPADGGVALGDEDRLAILTWARCNFPE